MKKSLGNPLIPVPQEANRKRVGEAKYYGNHFTCSNKKLLGL